MRVTHVVARAFGPFHGERLDLAPGLTVVTGPNESGKSSWHAALCVALCAVQQRVVHHYLEREQWVDSMAVLD